MKNQVVFSDVEYENRKRIGKREAFLIVKCDFGYRKVRCLGIKKNPNRSMQHEQRGKSAFLQPQTRKAQKKPSKCRII